MPEFLASIVSRTQNPPAAVPGVLGVLMTGLIFGCLICWLVATFRFREGKPLIPWQARESVPWNLIDVFVAVVLQFLFIFAGTMAFTITESLEFSGIAAESLSAAQQISIMVFGEVSMLIAVGLTVAYLMFRSRATKFDLGLSIADIPRDILIGVVAFMMLMMPVLLMQLGLEKLFPSSGNHPFVDLIREEGDDYMLGLIFVMAVLLAPIVEEFLFRVVIQGWLERFMAAPGVPSAPGTPDRQLTAAQNFVVIADVVDAEHATDESLDPADHPTSQQNPYSPPPALPFVRAHRLTSRVCISQSAPTDAWRIWGPIVVASALFAAAHVGHGTAPIPLFFLSLGLGYVYHRTHRIWPSLITHGLVNLLAVVQLKIALDSGLPI